MPYRRADLGRRAGEPREFYQDRAEPKIVRRIEKIIEADLTEPIALADDRYAGIVSAGTFTHGHLGPAAGCPWRGSPR